MIGIVFGIFIILHGLVHLLYFGQSWRFFELQPGMTWPDGSWAFSKLLGDETTRLLASITCVLAAIGLVAGGIGIFAKQGWWHPALVATGIFSAAIFFLFWDGKMQRLDDQGWIGVLIDIALLVAVLILQWPDFEF